VQPGENMLYIARSIGSTIADIQDGNCFDTIRGVFVGETILLPAIPAGPIATVEPVLPSDDMNLSPMGCTAGTAQIVMPETLTNVQGIFAVLGSATSNDFAYYKIEVRPEWSDIYSLNLESGVPVQNDLLGLVNAELYGTGLHRLRVTVVNNNNEIAENGVCEIPLVFTVPTG